MNWAIFANGNNEKQNEHTKQSHCSPLGVPLKCRCEGNLCKYSEIPSQV